MATRTLKESIITEIKSLIIPMAPTILTDLKENQALTRIDRMPNKANIFNITDGVKKEFGNTMVNYLIYGLEEDKSYRELLDHVISGLNTEFDFKIESNLYRRHYSISLLQKPLLALKQKYLPLPPLPLPASNILYFGELIQNDEQKAISPNLKIQHEKRDAILPEKPQSEESYVAEKAAQWYEDFEATTIFEKGSR